MPYITQTRRDEIDPALEEFQKSIAHLNLGVGDLNYIISNLVWDEYNKKPSYGQANNLLGVLSGVNMEFYRRKVAPYEEEKMEENGDLT
jgi:hypothetical protein